MLLPLWSAFQLATVKLLGKYTPIAILLIRLTKEKHEQNPGDWSGIIDV